ncbi:NAD(P)/FAD-dependent oxidoreductase [Candidatus Bathyarchaeota archaeon]|nr:NAD(P)/FAD-dependent oxidoreductase [Candidatus Bathyarchaeota archaeon]
MSETVDLLIVGAGPCGSFAALTASKLGLKVKVYEEHSEPGVPEHCPGHISIRGLKNLNLNPPKEIIENEIKGIKLYSPSGLNLTFEDSKPSVYVVNRKLFDKWLYNQAKSFNVNYVFNSKIKNLSFNKNELTVKAFSKNDESEARCSFLIDAEGSSGFLARKAGLINDRKLVCGVHAIIEGVKDLDEDFAEVYLGRSFSPNFFAWIIPKGGKEAKVGLAAEKKNPIALLKLFIKKHSLASKKIGNAKILSLFPHPIPINGPIKKFFHKNFLVAGDSASQVKPTTGGGLITGFISVKIAVEAIYEGDKDFGEKYQARWNKTLGLNFFFMRQARRLLNSLPDKALDKIFNVAKKLNIEEAPLMSNLDFQLNLVKPLAKKPFSWKVISFLSSF